MLLLHTTGQKLNIFSSIKLILITISVMLVEKSEMKHLHTQSGQITLQKYVISISFLK